MIERKIIHLKIGNMKWVNTVDISDEDRRILNEKDKLSTEFLEYATDADESPRSEYDEINEIKLLCFDVPYYDSFMDSPATAPLVFIIRENILYTFIEQNEDYVYLNKLLGKTVTEKEYESLYHLLFSVLYKFCLIYHDKLTKMNKERGDIKRSFKKAMKNSDIYKLLNIEQGLTYLSTSLKANRLALNTLKRRWKHKNGKLSEIEEEKLEDVLIEADQAAEMTEILITIVEKEKLAYSAIIDNNLNTTMKFLTIFTVLLAIPSMIFGFFGINTSIPFQNAENGWIYVILITVVICIIFIFSLWRNKFLK
ncbi:magnesium transporter CorA family protein [Leptotrichia sp. OH3620_COT-345]|uniref:magnesium transporter CorA family protein n=1 Tax=Leptotrichia sp. OH3620_COT-345 TaxID=2491048 RepID=UPI000F64A1B8|nr:magnesium transporter CorA family protein [Leptotrichia sp. OH3620_COT-345]RRD39747.1 magnesium transporter CorA family protein [Leptotrichia sp. OH3620_COT-345]